jgi:YHS domain-containing protein
MATNTHGHHEAAPRAGSCCSPANDGGCCARPEGAAGVAIDPVCGMEVDRNAPSGGSLALGGTTYYFCSPFCRAKFAGTAASER